MSLKTDPKIQRCVLTLMAIFLYSCSSPNEQEPLYHLFQHSKEYPSYSEFEFLKSKGGSLVDSASGSYLLMSDGEIDVYYQIADDFSLLSKDVIVHISRLDTLEAEKEIFRFGGIKKSSWKIINDSTFSIKSNYEDVEFQVSLKAWNEKTYLENTLGLWHRIYKCP